jgi:hypothetical protein
MYIQPASHFPLDLLYKYYRQEYHLILTAVHRLEKLTKDSLFYLFLKLIQINYIFYDNVRILQKYMAGKI